MRLMVKNKWETMPDANAHLSFMASEDKILSNEQKNKARYEELNMNLYRYFTEE